MLLSVETRVLSAADKHAFVFGTASLSSSRNSEQWTPLPHRESWLAVPQNGAYTQCHNYGKLIWSSSEAFGKNESQNLVFGVKDFGDVSLHQGSRWGFILLATSDFGEMDSMDFTPDSIGFYRILWFSSPDSIIFWILLDFIGFYSNILLATNPSKRLASGPLGGGVPQRFSKIRDFFDDF